jgi:hypothetical protein
MRHFMALVAVLALVLTACAEGDTGATPDQTIDLGGLGSPAATGPGDPGASPGAMDDDDEDTDAAASPAATGAGTAAGTPGASPAPRATDDDDDDDDTTAAGTSSPSPGPGTGTGTGTAAGQRCEEAFDDVPSLSRIDSLRQLQEAIAALDATIEACDSVSEWTEQAETQLDLGNLALDADSFLRERCQTEDLEDTTLCESL